MRAVQITTFGDPDTLRVVDLPKPSASAGTALVRVKAASINPSDVKNLAGAMSQTVLPRVPGRDYAGIVEAGPSDWVGAAVWGSGGDVGFTRDGTHAEYVLVPVASLSRKPEELDFQQASTIGVNFLTAWFGLVEAVKVQAGETVVILGAGGGVGGAAAQIAAMHGASVIGVDRRPPPPDSVITRVARHHLVDEADVAEAVRTVTAGRGADVVFDCVGGRTMFETAARCLARRGRLIEISATGGPMVEFNLADFYHNESILFGVDSLKRDLIAAASVLDALRPHFESGVLLPPPIARRLPLSRASEAYALVKAGTSGRIVLTM